MIRVLIVSSDKSGKAAPFVFDIEVNLTRLNVTYDYHLLRGNKGLGYLKGFFSLKRRIASDNFDLIHAHFGFSGLVAATQRKLPVVVTYHGTDVNSPFLRIFSWIALRLSTRVIYVSEKLHKILPSKGKGIVIPCGVDFEVFKPMDKIQCRKDLGLSSEGKYVLFSSSFDRQVKNPALAKAAISELKDDTILLELKGYSRSDVVKLINASDLCLLTSHKEGSPQFVKEALACNVLVVSTDVGDVRERYENIPNCLITSNDPIEIANAIRKGRNLNKVNSRDLIKNLDNNRLCEQVFSVYVDALKGK